MNLLASARPFSAGSGVFVAVLILAFPGVGMAEYSDAVKECMLQKMEVEDDDMTLGQLKDKCLSEQREDETAKTDTEAEGAEKALAGADNFILTPQ